MDRQSVAHEPRRDELADVGTYITSHHITRPASHHQASSFFARQEQINSKVGVDLEPAAPHVVFGGVQRQNIDMLHSVGARSCCRYCTQTDKCRLHLVRIGGKLVVQRRSQFERREVGPVYCRPFARCLPCRLRHMHMFPHGPSGSCKRDIAPGFASALCFAVRTN